MNPINRLSWSKSFDKKWQGQGLRDTDGMSHESALSEAKAAQNWATEIGFLAKSRVGEAHRSTACTPKNRDPSLNSFRGTR